MNKKWLVVLGAIVIIILLVIFTFYSFHDVYYHYAEEYLNNISFVISDKFSVSKYSRGYYSHYDNDVSCNFIVEDYYGDVYSDGSEYLKKYVYFTLSDEVSDIEEVTLNGYPWYFMRVDNKNGVSYYYSTIWNGTGYKIEYSIRNYGLDNNRNSFCYMEYDEVISSVKFK